MLDAVRGAGFVDAVERKVKVPLHGRPGDPQLRQMGYLGHAALDQSLDGFGLYLFTEVLVWSREETAALTAEMRKELRKASNCPWFEA